MKEEEPDLKEKIEILVNKEKKRFNSNEDYQSGYYSGAITWAQRYEELRRKIEYLLIDEDDFRSIRRCLKRIDLKLKIKKAQKQTPITHSTMSFE